MSDTSINRDEAAAALATARASEQRSQAFFNYRMQAPVMMLWGVLWFTADMAMAFAPWDWLRNQAWGYASVIGLVLTTIYYWRWSSAPQRRPRSMGIFWRFMGTYVFVGIFIGCAVSVLAPFDWRQPAAFWGLFWGFMYAINGVWSGWRLTALGAVMIGGVLYTFYALPDAAYLPVMGVVCGGGMVLGGFWLRAT